MPVSSSSAAFHGLRPTRARLNRTTALCGAVAATLVVAAPALAQQQCGVPIDGQVRCTVAGGPYTGGVSYPDGATLPADLTIVVDDGVAIGSSDDGQNALDARNVTGSLTITGAGSSIASSGNGAGGVYGAAMGDVSLALGDVSTAGYGARGVVAQSFTGNATVSVGQIETAKAGGSGLFVVAGGLATVDIGTIHTIGDGATGAEAHGNAVDLTLTGTIRTEGAGSAGIRSSTIGGGNSVHNNGVIITSGDRATGLYAATTQGFVQIDGAGTIETHGNGAYGIDARGQDGPVTISATGDITTTGSNALGISARVTRSPYFFYPADLTIAAGKVTTSGSGAAGISAYDSTGTVHLAANGPVSTSGYGAQAIRVLGAGNVYEDINAVATQGDHASGVYTYAAANTYTYLHGAVTTRGAYAAGVTTVTSGTGKIVNDGSITTSGDNSPGVLDYGNRTAGVVSTGGITTSGKYAPGIVTVSTIQDIVLAHDIHTSGYASDGIVMNSYFRAYAYTYGAITTSGDRSAGVNAHVGGNYIASKYSLGVTNYGSISTSGHYSNGIYARSEGSLSMGNTGAITTSGGEAAGLNAFGAIDASITNVGAIQTSGILSNGVDATAVFGHLQMVQGGTVATAGDRSAGVSLVAGGGITLTGRGGVHTSGGYADGITATALDLGAYAGTAPIQYGHGDGITLVAGTVATDGAHSRGIVVRGREDAIQVDVDGVRTLGMGSTGIDISGNGDIGVIAQSVATAGNNASGIIATSAKGSITASVGTIVASGGNSDALALTAAGGAQIDVAAGGAVSGSRNGIAITLQGGAAQVTNAGTIAGGSGNAITVAGGAANIVNAGIVRGSVQFGGFDDSFANAGAFAAAGTSDFGGGNDRFVNTGTLTLAPSALGLGTTQILNLEQFANQGGTIDLRNGHIGDTLELGGDYVASGAARLHLEVGRSAATGTLAADRLVIDGAATGATTIQLTHLDAGNAVLTAQPLTLVTVGAGSADGAFTLAPQSAAVGFVRYALGYDAATRSYQLASAPGAPVYRLTRANAAAQSVWRYGAEAATGHTRQLRDGAWNATGARQSGLWGDLQAGSEKRDAIGIMAGVAGIGAATYDAGYRQSHFAAQLGYDLVGGFDADGGFVLGAVGGYSSSRLRQSGDQLAFDSANGGLYAGYLRGGFFANLQAQYARHWIDATSQSLGYADRIGGSTWGGQSEAGYRFGSTRFFVEPVASLAWTHTDLGNLSAFGQTVDFDAANGLQGKAGTRIGGRLSFGGGATAIVYAAGDAIHDFAGHDGLTFLSGGTRQTIRAAGIATYGEARIGVDLLTNGPLSGFVEGNLDVGGSASGGGGRLGLRLKL